MTSDAATTELLREEIEGLKKSLETSSSEGDFRYQLLVLVLSLLVRDELPLGRLDRVLEKATHEMRAGKASEGGNVFDILLRELWDLDRMMNLRVRKILETFEANYCEWNAPADLQPEPRAPSPEPSASE